MRIMDAVTLGLETVLSQEFMQNAFVVWRRGTRSAVVIDPGFAVDPILDLLRREGLQVEAILNTHGHLDHIAGNAALKQAFPNAELIIGRADASMLTDTRENLSDMFGYAVLSPPADRILEGGERFRLAGLEFVSRAVPGHSPGSLVFLVGDGRVLEDDPPILFGGDTLFAGSIGRTDLPHSAPDLLIDGLRRLLQDLPDEVEVYPGHGPSTTIGLERRRNPFVGEPSRDLDHD